jgi:hypothetical protein
MPVTTGAASERQATDGDISCSVSHESKCRWHGRCDWCTRIIIIKQQTTEIHVKFINSNVEVRWFAFLLRIPDVSGFNLGIMTCCHA